MIQINPLKSYIDGGIRAALTTPPSASLVFDLPGKAIWVKGVKLKGTDHTYTFNHDNYITLTNTPDKNNPESEDIKIGVNITTLKNIIDTTYNGGTLALLLEGLNTEERTWLAKILHNYINDILPVTKNLKINGTNYAIYTTENSLPLFFAPTSLGATGQILACTSSGLSWIDLIQNTDYRVSLSSATSNSDYRIILKQGADNNPETNFVRFSEYLTFNPSTKTLKINNIKVITAADIYAGSNAGLVPAATSEQLNYYLRGDGTWVNIATEMATANTWRPIKVENIDALSSGTDTGTLSFTAGTGITLAWDATNKRIIITNNSPDQNHNTDENVRQVPKTDDVNRPLMMINGGTSAGEQINTSMFSTGIYANASTKMITANGFIKAGSSDDYVLLGGGNHKAISDFATSGHNHDGRYLRWNGSAADVSAMGWGTLTTANGYTILSHAASSDGGDVGFTSKGGQIFMLLDGYYYQNEGRYRVLDTSDFTAFNNIGNLTTRITIGGVTKDLKIDADTIDGYHAGYLNNNVALLCPWPSISTMQNTGFLTNAYGTSGYGHPDNIYLLAICKWAIATYPNLGDITLMGVIYPNSSGTCILHLYSNSGKDSSTLLPRYCSGTYTTLGGRIYHFGTVNYSWFYKLEALTSDIPTVTDYYWANVKISSSSNTTTTPIFGKLYISGEYPHIDMTSTSAESSIYFRPSSGTSWTIGKAPWGVSGFGIGILNDGSKLTILDNGNVGIGTTNPSQKLDVRGDTRIIGSIRDLAVGGGIYWNPYVESTTDNTDAASITLVKSGVAGGTTLVLSLMNDTNDTILFLTNTAARLYHNSYPILTTLNTYVSNNKGYINNAEITLVNNADTIDGYHANTFEGRYEYIVDLSNYSNTKYYPVYFSWEKWRRVRFSFIGSSMPSNFSERDDKSSYIWFEEEISTSGWSGEYGLARIIYSHEEWGGNGKAILAKVSQNTRSSLECFWLRGGCKYTMYCNINVGNPIIVSSSYTSNSITFTTIDTLLNFKRLNDDINNCIGINVGIKALYATNANTALLLALNTNPVSTVATAIGNWSPVSNKVYVYRQRWTNSAAGGDTADLSIYLDGNLTANMCLDGYYYSLLGFKKGGSSDSYVLLGGGGHKALSDFSMAHNHPYLSLSGGTMTGDILSTRPMKLGCNGTGTYVNYHCMYLGYHSTNDLYFYEEVFHFRTNGASTDLVTISGNNITAAGQFYANSDIRYKLIQSLLLNKVNLIAELPIFTYYWNDKLHDKNLHIGSSAQAVKEVFPELVTYDESRDFYNLDYATLGTIAGITACKELVTLKSELQELKEKVKLLEDKLRKYENTL